MAKLKNKDITKLETWDMKELRKLRITIKNRISSLESNSKKSLPNGHLLIGMGIKELDELLLNVRRAEKSLASE